MKIGLSYINGTNHGDQIIYQTAKYIVEKALKESNIFDYEIVPIDICLIDFSSNIALKKLGLYRRKNFFKKRMKDILFKYYDRKILNSKTETKAQKMIQKEWHLTNTYKVFHFAEESKIQNLDLMIFSGGGIIKYHQQYFHLLINDITTICEKKNIPIFIMAAGIEGYNKNDPRCNLLKQAINRKCVKYISTRDDYKTLKNCYVTNSAIKTELVCDPAFWIKERYRIQEPFPKKKIIGLNAIRPEIFQDYLYSVDIENLKNVYHELILLLLKDGYQVELFSNGVKADGNFLKILIDDYNDLQEFQKQNKLTIFLPSQPRRLIKRLTTYERFMAVRLHAAIIGTSLGIPNVSLVWCVKQLLFGEQTDTLENYITKENFNASYIYNSLLNSKPYHVPLEYKNSIYNGIKEQIDIYFKNSDKK